MDVRHQYITQPDSTSESNFFKKKLNPYLRHSKVFRLLLILVLFFVFVIGSFLLPSNKHDKFQKNISKGNINYVQKIKKEEQAYSEQSNESVNSYLGVSCKSNPNIQFTHDFTENEKIKMVEPTIITPGNSRHRAWLDIDTSKSNRVAIYAPVDSELVNGVYKNARGALDYDLHFQVSCEIWYLINHVTEPVEKIKNAFPTIPQTDTRLGPPFKQSIKVKAGELLGYSTGTPLARNFDFGVFDLNHVNVGLPADEGSNYGKEKNFICPFDLLPEQIKKSYYSKIITSEKPYSNCKVF